MVASQFLVKEFVGTFQAFPPRMKAASFTVDQIMAKMEAGITGD